MANNKETKLAKEVYSGMVEEEWNRLTQDAFHRLEFDTTFKFLKKHLPKKGLILDAGGGPGRYTIELAKLGYDVVLVDLVKENLDLAKKKIKEAGVEGKVRNVVEASITDLSMFGDNYFDAVLCLGGPLSHVHPYSERGKAVSELTRVCKNDSKIFASVMGRYGVLLRGPFEWPGEAALKKHLESVVFEGEDYKWRRDYYCHYFTSEELKNLFWEEDLELLEMVGLEGLNVDETTTNNFAEEYPEAWKNWIEIHHKICTDPFVVEASSHIMIIVKKN